MAPPLPAYAAGTPQPHRRFLFPFSSATERQTPIRLWQFPALATPADRFRPLDSAAGRIGALAREVGRGQLAGSGDHHVIGLHGWFGSARGWGSLPDYLDSSAYTYAFMDLRGYGDRRQVPGDFTMEEAAADAIALADELGWDCFSLIGHSMSGQAIQHVLLQEPGRVRSGRRPTA